MKAVVKRMGAHLDALRAEHAEAWDRLNERARQAGDGALRRFRMESRYDAALDAVAAADHAEADVEAHRKAKWAELAAALAERRPDHEEAEAAWKTWTEAYEPAVLEMNAAEPGDLRYWPHFLPCPPENPMEWEAEPTLEWLRQAEPGSLDEAAALASFFVLSDLAGLYRYHGR